MPDPTRRFAVKRGDTQPSLQVQILNPDGTPRNCTGHVVTFRMGQAGQARKVDTAATTTVNAVQGIYQYDWGANDLNTLGDFRAEFVVDGNDTYPKDGYIIVSVEERV